MMRSTLLWLVSRSCQRAEVSRAATGLPRVPAPRGLHGGRQMGGRPDTAAELPGGGDGAGASEPLLGAAEFVVHEREFEAESRGLGVDAVAAADARGEHVFFRPARDDLP